MRLQRSAASPRRPQRAGRLGSPPDRAARLHGI